ncbi:hypothetical protein H5410_016802 [Solanum commersonii]|uniref:Uncharacterized protein n=1 Tax=Solanum commersonii TaxID=4109 RepID=A0A9J5ZYB2_SOLCO|nr:hypothetical protein H5410_016802 [Solanum commersonii]
MKFTPSGESYSALLQKLKKIVSDWVYPTTSSIQLACVSKPMKDASIIQALDTKTDNCRTLKGLIEKLINYGVVAVTDDQNAPMRLITHF